LEHECEDDASLLKVLTDHKNVKRFMTMKLQNQRQARWSEFSTLCNFEIVYSPGKSNGIADAVTKSPGDLPERGDDRLGNIEQVFLKPENLLEQLVYSWMALWRRAIPLYVIFQSCK